MSGLSAHLSQISPAVNVSLTHCLHSDVLLLLKHSKNLFSLEFKIFLSKYLNDFVAHFLQFLTLSHLFCITFYCHSIHNVIPFSYKFISPFLPWFPYKDFLLSNILYVLMVNLIFCPSPLPECKFQELRDVYLLCSLLFSLCLKQCLALKY